MTVLQRLRPVLPLLTTVVVGGAMYAAAAAAYPHFGDRQTAVDFVGGSGPAFLGVAAVGLTFVILAGGIDLSVGAVIGCSTVVLALLVERHHVPPAAAAGIVLAIGAAFGAAQGLVIRLCRVPPFLLTLAGLFLARGVALVLSDQPVAVTAPLVVRLSAAGVTLGHDDRHFPITLSAAGVALLATAAAGAFVGRYTRFGRNCYAVGGSEPSAVLLGLPVGATVVGAYAVSGFCAALAGVVAAVGVQKGDPNYASGLELDAIAAVVVGGTALTGGTGSVLGTLLGVVTFAVMGAIITFQGLPPAWNRIFVGGLLLGFILLQKAVGRTGRR